MSKSEYWISCEKKLPDRSDEYLVTRITGFDNEYGIITNVETAFFELELDSILDCEAGISGWAQYDNRGDNPVSITESVIAWAELPEPYSLGELYGAKNHEKQCVN